MRRAFHNRHRFDIRASTKKITKEKQKLLASPVQRRLYGAASVCKTKDDTLDNGKLFIRNHRKPNLKFLLIVSG